MFQSAGATSVLGLVTLCFYAKVMDDKRRLPRRRNIQGAETTGVATQSLSLADVQSAGVENVRWQLSTVIPELKCRLSARLLCALHIMSQFGH